MNKQISEKGQFFIVEFQLINIGYMVEIETICQTP